MKNIAIFASGNGTNAERIVTYFLEKKTANVSAIFCNNPKAYVLERAKRLNVPTIVFNRNDFYHSNLIMEQLQSLRTDLIVLAGFLWLMPQNMVERYSNRIINIHPALLPKYGGKGMYGEHVHEAVVANHETESGITIHYVNEQYDSGDIIFQARCQVAPSDTPDYVAAKSHELEQAHFPLVIEQVVNTL